MLDTSVANLPYSISSVEFQIWFLYYYYFYFFLRHQEHLYDKFINRYYFCIFLATMEEKKKLKKERFRKIIQEAFLSVIKYSILGLLSTMDRYVSLPLHTVVLPVVQVVCNL
uniref:Uncharacterized protein n=1 Tax=Cacopsylla melanoneura TaxID=428564 RepID=A0A8D8TND4_9HEMI